MAKIMKKIQVALRWCFLSIAKENRKAIRTNASPYVANSAIPPTENDSLPDKEWLNAPKINPAIMRAM